jgi:hypothetical protein
VLLELRHACLLRFDGHADAEDAVPRDGFGGQLSDAPRTFSAPQAFFALVSELAKRLVSGRGCGCVVILPGSVRFRA